MVLTTEQYQRLIQRLTALEQHVNDLTVAADKYITREQITQLQVILETDMDTMQEQLEALEARVTSIETEPLS